MAAGREQILQGEEQNSNFVQLETLI